jgi:protein-disulfide isomerase
MSQKPEEQPIITLSPQTLLVVMVAAVFFAVGMVVGGVVFGGSSLDEATVDRIVRDALAEVELATPVDRFALVDDDPSLGPDDAPVVIVEFSAYGCPYCKQFHDETLPSILENYGDVVRYVYRDMPTVNPEVSYPAAWAAECADDQGKFWEYHDALFEQQTELSGEVLVSIAQGLALNMTTFNECMDSNKYNEEVNADFLDGAMNGVTTTPNFFINGEYYAGAQPYSFFEEIIQRELLKAEARRS